MTGNAVRRARLEWSLLGAALLALGAALAYAVFVERGEVRRLEEDRLQVQARVVADNLQRQLEGVGNALSGARDDLPQWDRGTMRVASSRRLGVLVQVMPGVRNILVANAAGIVLDSNQREVIGSDVSAQEFFRVPKAKPDSEQIYVSPPHAAPQEAYAINLTRVLTGPKGEFAGIVSAALDSEYFSVLLRSILYAADMRVVLVHWGGRAFVFMPQGADRVGIDLAKPGSFFSRHRESGQIATLGVGTSVATGEERLMASRTVDHAGARLDNPMIVHVSRNLADMYQPWRAQSTGYALLYGLVALAAGSGLFLIQRRRRMTEDLAAVRESERRQSAERLELALAGADLGLWDVDLNTGREIFNERWCSMLGYRQSEVEPHASSWERLVHPEDMPAVRAAMDAHLKGATAVYETEHRLRHKDGRWVWVLARGKVMARDSSGAPLRVLGTHMDITERKRAEEVYKSVIQASIDGFWVTDFTGQVLEVNAAICRMLGYSADELLGMRLSDIEAKESPQEIEARVQLIMSAGSAQFQGRHRRKDGSIMDVDVSVVHVAALGKRLFAFVRDVTERRRAEEELRRSIAFRELLSEATPLPVFHKDASGRYLGCNSAFARFVGRTREEICGKTLTQIAPTELALAYEQKDRELLADPGGVQTYEGGVAHADGTMHDVIFHKARMTDAGGAAIGIVGVITDITELKRIQARRDQLEEQLRQSQKMEALGTLAGGVAHDFNNIVAAIMGNVELARQDVGPGHAALESLDEIRKASRRAKDLVQQILAFGRRQKSLRKVIALAPVVEESMKLLRTTLPAGVSLSVQCAPDAPAVLADATQVEQVLLNLCSNAWQAVQSQSRAGEIVVTLQAHQRGAVRTQDTGLSIEYGELSPGLYACISVRDNGTGMDKETLGRIFEPFFTTKPVDKGTGLGLAVVHGIVQEHDGGLEVHSIPGAGSTFRVYFPAAEAAAAAEREHAGAAPAHGQGKRVLFVDDDESIVFLFTRLLERQGYRVSGYTDARIALAAVRAEPGRFDLAVTDYNMPGMSGLDVARALREIRADLPVAVASGYITDELRTNAPASGVRELIYKPNTVEELCEAVARLAGRLPS